MWEDQRIVARPRYRDLISALRFVARQELIFGMHVHVGVDDPDKAIHVANGMRVHLPVLLGAVGQLAVLARRHRPAWRRRGRRSSAPSRASGSRRTTRTGRTTSAGSSSWSSAGVIEDYTYLWHDVRPHPMFGTVEIRVMDSQTRIEHSLGLAALVQAMVKELAEHFDAGKPLSPYPFEMLDENKWLAARHGLDGELVDLPGSDRVRDAGAGAAAHRPPARALRQDLGSAAELEADRGPARARQRRRRARSSSMRPTTICAR